MIQVNIIARFATGRAHLFSRLKLSMLSYDGMGIHLNIDLKNYLVLMGLICPIVLGSLLINSSICTCHQIAWKIARCMHKLNTLC